MCVHKVKGPSDRSLIRAHGVPTVTVAWEWMMALGASSTARAGSGAARTVVEGMRRWVGLGGLCLSVGIRMSSGKNSVPCDLLKSLWLQF